MGTRLVHLHMHQFPWSNYHVQLFAILQMMDQLKNTITYLQPDLALTTLNVSCDPVLQLILIVCIPQ